MYIDFLSPQNSGVQYSGRMLIRTPIVKPHDNIPGPPRPPLHLNGLAHAHLICQNAALDEALLLTRRGSGGNQWNAVALQTMQQISQRAQSTHLNNSACPKSSPLPRAAHLADRPEQKLLLVRQKLRDHVRRGIQLPQCLMRGRRVEFD